MSMEDSALTKNKKSKKSKSKKENEAMDITPDVILEKTQSPGKKRKADVLDAEHNPDDLSAKETKKLRKLAKEQARKERKGESELGPDQVEHEKSGKDSGKEEKKKKKEREEVRIMLVYEVIS